MSPVNSAVRIVREDDEDAVADRLVTAAAGAAAAAPRGPARSEALGDALSEALIGGGGGAAVEQHVAVAQSEIRLLQQEVELLRRRDDTLKFYMQRLDEELRLAARLQQDFLPKTLPAVGPVRFHALYRPAGYVSGDLYDVMRLDEHHVGVYMADAVGHGMPAALLSMFLKNALVTKEIGAGGYRLLSPSESIGRLNDALVEQNLSASTFATAAYCVVDTRTLRLTFARGGHPSPLLLRKTGALEAVDADGSLLGVFPGEEFTQTTIQLQPGDRLFVFTDGIEVAFNDEESVGDTHRWRDELVNVAQLPTDELLYEFARRLDGQAGSLSPKDDLTVVVLEVKT